jgi:glucosamine--fructose-6-phosphate aminotransferase (isomerizing)
VCGIIGYTGTKLASSIIADGLLRLEYRGYDSAGVAVIDQAGSMSVRKSSGKLNALLKSIKKSPLFGSTGVGHTRWATHGSPSQLNSHPQIDCRGEIAVVHNGIIENYANLKKELLRDGHTLVSQTDTEVIAHLIEACMRAKKSMITALRDTAKRLQGPQAIIVISRNEPNTIAGLKLGNAGGIVVGHGQREMYLASDLPAILPYTKLISRLGDGEMVSVTPENVSYFTIEGDAIFKQPKAIAVSKNTSKTSQKGKYNHYTLKEIMEQPEAMKRTIDSRIDKKTGTIKLENIGLSNEAIKKIDKIFLVGMGSSYHASIIGRHMIESLVNMPAEAENASEFALRNTRLNNKTLLVATSQSGETADTLISMEKARKSSCKIIAISNVAESQASLIADGTILLKSGPEVGVGSTKTFISSIIDLYMLSLYISVAKGIIDKNKLKTVIDELCKLPAIINDVLADHSQYISIAAKLSNHSSILCLARGLNYATAMEGALKLKELSYIHAEACLAGEMKHGPIALIDETTPIVAIAPQGPHRDKMINSISEVKARDGQVITIGTIGDRDLQDISDYFIEIPESSELIAPVLATIPLQLIAYYLATEKSHNVDQPRNLAKTVTVE